MNELVRRASKDRGMIFGRARFLTLLAVLVSTAPVGARAATFPVHVVVDGRPVRGTNAFSRSGTVFIDLIGAVRLFDGLCVFDGPTATVSIGRSVAVFTVGSTRANLDGAIVSTGGASFDQNGDRFVPLDFFAKKFARASLRVSGDGRVAKIVRRSKPRHANY
jgi:hypothetical protein